MAMSFNAFDSRMPGAVGSLPVTIGEKSNFFGFPLGSTALCFLAAAGAGALMSGAAAESAAASPTAAFAACLPPCFLPCFLASGAAAGLGTAGLPSVGYAFGVALAFLRLHVRQRFS